MTKAISAKSRGKLTKKELKQDRLIEFTAKAESFYHRHQSLVLGIAAAVVVVILAAVVINRSQKSARLDESYQLTLAKMNYGAGQLDQARQGFEQIVSQYGGKTAGEAKFFLGRIAFDQGDFATAESQFTSYVSEFSVDDAMDAAALSGLAASLEAQGKLDQALAQYEKLSTEHPSVAYAPQSLLQVARLAMKLEKPDVARKALTTIVDKYPETSAVQQARKELDALE